MRVVRVSEGLPDAYRGAALAIGNFDGLHRGHQAVLAEMLTQARTQRLSSAVMTFEPHPRMYFNPSHQPHRIEPLHSKLRRLQEYGVEIVYLQRFNKALSSKKADDFVRGILSHCLGVKHVVTGEEFVFGHQRQGSSATLNAAARDGLFGYSAVPALEVAGAACSSSRIREALVAGQMDLTAQLLGRVYEMVGRVSHGDARGRELGAPTANVQTQDIFLPRYGVYAVRYALWDGSFTQEGQHWREGVANLGVRPTFGQHAPLLEVHGFDEQRDLYGKRLRVKLLSFLRPEQKFASSEALRTQILSDISAAKEVLRQC